MERMFTNTNLNGTETINLVESNGRITLTHIDLHGNARTAHLSNRATRAINILLDSTEKHEAEPETMKARFHLLRMTWAYYEG